MPVWPVADKQTLTNSLLLRKTQSTKILFHKYSYLIILKFYGVGQNNGPFLGRGLPSIFRGQKKARISGHYPDSVLDGQKIPPFPGQFAMVTPETWSARQRGWQIRRPAAQSKLRELGRRARAACFVPRAKSRHTIGFSPLPQTPRSPR